jgi:phage terminase large subunit-like protein
MDDDKFRAEIARMHSVRQAIRDLDAAGREAFVRGLVETGAGSARDWLLCARDSQIPPLGHWAIWLMLAGRGFGKTHALSATCHMAVRAGLQRINYVVPTAADAYDVAVNGPSGILHTAGSGPAPRWEPSKRRCTWPNGAICAFYSGDEPDQLRGPQAELCLIDEIARMAKQAEVFSNADFGLRLGPVPRMIIATTPKPTLFIKELVKKDRLVKTTGTTYDNAAHLPPAFLERMKFYEGTRKGRQELFGELLLDPENALFLDHWICRDPVAPEMIEQVSVGVDPSGGADEVGIVVGALLTDGRFGVLADRSLKAATPGQWGDAVVQAHDEFGALDCTVEVNYGGAMATDVIKSAAQRAHQDGKRDSDLIRVREVVASRGKVLRAEPVALLYEKAKVLHRPGMGKLEEEMLSFGRDHDTKTDGSPNRLDAAVHVISRLSKIITSIPIA